VTAGPDGPLYAKRAGPNESVNTPRVDGFDPATMAPVRSVTLQTEATDSRSGGRVRFTPSRDPPRRA
jgi:hypothetical protein